MKVELKRYTWSDYCEFDTRTGSIKYYKDKKIEGCTGLYFEEDKTFFALYPVKNALMMFYEGKEYRLHDGLTITLKIEGKNRRFEIAEYDISVDYEEQMADEFFDENEADLFYKIQTEYRGIELYEGWIKTSHD